MSIRSKKLAVLFIPAFIVVVIDQVTKYMVRTNPGLQRVEWIEGWLAFNFTKNPGMAMGMDWLSTFTISIIAIVATIVIIGYIFFTLEKANFGYLFCMGLIIGGALGNIGDRLFMAIIGGYGGLLEGHVVDFIHFTARIGDTPVFPYIFNVADIAISTSIIILLLFHKKIMPVEAERDNESESEGAKPEPEAQLQADSQISGEEKVTAANHNSDDSRPGESGQ